MDWIPFLPIDIIRLIRWKLSPKDLYNCFLINRQWNRTFALSVLKLSLNCPPEQNANFNFSKFSNLQTLEIIARNVQPQEFDSFLGVKLRTLDINWRPFYPIDKLVLLSGLENLHLRLSHKFSQVSEFQTNLESMNLKFLEIHGHTNSQIVDASNLCLAKLSKLEKLIIQNSRFDPANLPTGLTNLKMQLFSDQYLNLFALTNLRILECDAYPFHIKTLLPLSLRSFLVRAPLITMENSPKLVYCSWKSIGTFNHEGNAFSALEELDATSVAIATLVYPSLTNLTKLVVASLPQPRCDFLKKKTKLQYLKLGHVADNPRDWLKCFETLTDLSIPMANANYITKLFAHLSTFPFLTRLEAIELQGSMQALNSCTTLKKLELHSTNSKKKVLKQIGNFYLPLIKFDNQHQIFAKQ
jgi:hypothetical protein